MEHPITPPPELIQQWWDGTHGAFYEFEAVATQAAQWGADQELEACCADLRMVLGPNQADWLHSVRRPQPPISREVALAVLDDISHRLDSAQENLLRRALEALPNGRSSNP